jgi:translation initiation factor IF-3
MERVAAEMMDVATLDKPPKMEGRQLAMYLASKGVVKRRPEGTDAEDED